jgi:hypothetical protein
MGFYAAMKLSLLSWSKLLQTDSVEGPIEAWIVDDTGLAKEGVLSTCFAVGARRSARSSCPKPLHAAFARFIAHHHDAMSFFDGIIHAALANDRCPPTAEIQTETLPETQSRRRHRVFLANRLPGAYRWPTSRLSFGRT